MTDNEKVAKVKIYLGTDTVPSDAVILSYLDDAKQRITEAEYPFCDITQRDSGGNLIWTMSTKYEQAQCELASRMLFRVGFQGQLTSNENGIIRGWETVDDKDILNRITPKVGY